MADVATTMKAAILVEQHQPLVVDEVELPAELAPGQVLVRVHYSGVCGSQLGEIDGVKGPDPFLPHLLGHEGYGTVESCGPGVHQVVAGDRVVMHWRRGAGIDAKPPTYRWHGQPLNAGWVTTFNELAVVSENRLTRVDNDVDGAAATLLGCPVTTGLGVVTNDARLTLGESVVVLGVGGVGLSVVQGAAMVSAWPIVAVDLNPAHLKLAEKLGASCLVDSTDLNIEDSVRAAVGAAGADVVVETTGDADMISLAADLANSSGRVVLVGVPHRDEPARLRTLPFHLGKQLVGSHGGGTVPERDIPRYLDLYRADKLDLDALITDRFGLGEVNDAIAALRRGDIAGRCLLEISPP